jgi:hypothetical protein
LEPAVQDIRQTQDATDLEQRVEITHQEKPVAQPAPQPLDPELLRQIGGGVTEAPGHGW